MVGRFVILIHSGHGARHYDLMLERPAAAAGGALATWQIDCLPAGMKAGDSMTARRLADHRLAYLTYEGPVSGGRGEVRRADEGTCELLPAADGSPGQHEQADLWRVRLAGRQVRGTYRLQFDGPGDDQWRLVCEEAAPPD